MYPLLYHHYSTENQQSAKQTNFINQRAIVEHAISLTLVAYHFPNNILRNISHPEPIMKVIMTTTTINMFVNLTVQFHLEQHHHKQITLETIHAESLWTAAQSTNKNLRSNSIVIQRGVIECLNNKIQFMFIV